MKVVDVNVLIYAVNRRSAHHEKVRQWWESAISAGESIGLAWVVIVGFLRLTTQRGVLDRPVTPEVAIALVDDWLAQPNIRLLSELDGHWDLLRGFLQQVGTAGNLTNDAHLAAIAIANGATLISADRDFSRFTGLRWENPID